MVMENNKYDSVMKSLGYEMVQANRRMDPTPADFEALQTKLGRNLPGDYKEFIEKYGLTGSDDGHWTIRGGTEADGGSVNVFYGFGPTSAYDLRSEVGYFDEDELPSHVLPIASSAGGSYIVMSLAGDDEGWVYCWHPEDPFGGDTTDFIAKDFDSFLRILVRE
jgi:hypothetical protein